MKHKHYEVLVQWLADQTLNLQFSSSTRGWEDAAHLNPISHPSFEWRIKPKMVKVGRHEWPMPLEVAPAVGSNYWVASPCSAVASNWANDATDRERLSQAIVHLTEAAAQQHADALVCINRGDV